MAQEEEKFNHSDLVRELMKLGYGEDEAHYVANGNTLIFSETNLEIAKENLRKKEK